MNWIAAVVSKVCSEEENHSEVFKSPQAVSDSSMISAFLRRILAHISCVVEAI